MIGIGRLGRIAIAVGACTLLACGSEVTLADRGEGDDASSDASTGGTGGSSAAGGGASVSSTPAASSASSSASSGSGGAGGGAGGSGLTGGDVLDPAEVYLAGTLQEGACYRDALAHWSTPDVAATGFDCYFDALNAMIRPADGRMLYVNTFEDLLRQFTCDDCPSAPGASYPSTPLANDTVLPTPCAGNAWTLSFLLSPDGDTLHTCDNAVWFDENGSSIYADADSLLHLGFGHTALTTQRVVDLATQQAADIVGLPATGILTTRAVSPGGFWVVVLGAQGFEERWKVGTDGLAVFEGTYPPPPAEAKNVYSYTGKLEASGALLQFGQGPAVFQDIIIRRTLEGASAVVYDEATDPLVKVHISGLVTGP